MLNKTTWRPGVTSYSRNACVSSLAKSSYTLHIQLLLTGYDGGLPWWGGDGDGDVDGVAVESGLTGPGGVLLVVSVLLLLSQTQVAPPHGL